MINKLKADVTKKDNNNNTILFPTANNFPGKVVELIIKQYIESFGRDRLKNFINHKNKDEMDALDVALNSGNEKAIEVLSSYGADIENKVTPNITVEKPNSTLDGAESIEVVSPIKKNKSISKFLDFI
ncbi:putative ankyrin repeat domain protein [Wolbachia endosymbiont of Trichogramma pretiosum]|nr:hypothetical protein [Wolbachia endosymbiont of Trichogramma pretiosum]OCA06360.1 putative ankyrin repeat domain protein [Wolbachia endosymbiont of Trichogramma pretiosum]